MLLREGGATASFESQCTLSRAKSESAPDAARVDILTACVALHPRNAYGRSDLLEYAKYLPNLTTAEETLYRKNLVERCEAKANDEAASCAEGCACEDSGKLTGKCKKACARCRSEMSQRLRLCKKITEAPSAVYHPPKPPPPPAPVRALPPAKAVPDEAPAPRLKKDTGKGLKPMEI
jgi:hypothetical protein